MCCQGGCGQPGRPVWRLKYWTDSGSWAGRHDTWASPNRPSALNTEKLWLVEKPAPICTNTKRKCLLKLCFLSFFSYWIQLCCHTLAAPPTPQEASCQPCQCATCSVACRAQKCQMNSLCRRTCCCVENGEAVMWQQSVMWDHSSREEGEY